LKNLLALSIFGLATMASQSASACQSEVTLSITSSNYSGLISVELREGRRPGSKVVRRDGVDTRGTVIVPGVCPGTYFFAFSTPKDEAVSVTRYFEVTDDGTSYSNPTITVMYSRVTSGGQRVGSSRKSDL
jgi:hypothetical protein